MASFGEKLINSLKQFGDDLRTGKKFQTTTVVKLSEKQLVHLRAIYGSDVEAELAKELGSKKVIIILNNLPTDEARWENEGGK